MKYYYANNDNVIQGPYSLEQLKTKHLTEETKIWYSSLNDWIRLKEDVFLVDKLIEKESVPDIFYTSDGINIFGPYTEHEVEKTFCDNNTLVWNTKYSQWAKLCELDRFKCCFNIVEEKIDSSIKIPKTYMLESVVIALLFSLPLGIWAIYTSKKCKDYIKNNDLVSATKYSKRARNIILFTILITPIILYFVFNK